MSEETKCPLCSKKLVNGRCDDCGYQVDDVVMENQRTEFYTQRRETPRGNYDTATNSPSAREYYGQNGQQGSSMTGTEKAVLLILIFFIPIVAIIVAGAYKKKYDSEDDRKFCGTVEKIAIVLLVIEIFCVVISFIGSSLTGYNAETVGETLGQLFSMQ